jgi:hypothetical protein
MIPAVDASSGGGHRHAATRHTAIHKNHRAPQQQHANWTNNNNVRRSSGDGNLRDAVLPARAA